MKLWILIDELDNGFVNPDESWREVRLPFQYPELSRIYRQNNSWMLSRDWGSTGQTIHKNDRETYITLVRNKTRKVYLIRWLN